MHSGNVIISQKDNAYQITGVFPFDNQLEGVNVDVTTLSVEDQQVVENFLNVFGKKAMLCFEGCLEGFEIGLIISDPVDSIVEEYNYATMSPTGQSTVDAFKDLLLQLASDNS